VKDITKQVKLKLWWESYTFTYIVQHG